MSPRVGNQSAEGAEGLAWSWDGRTPLPWGLREPQACVTPPHTRALTAPEDQQEVEITCTRVIPACAVTVPILVNSCDGSLQTPTLIYNVHVNHPALQLTATAEVSPS